MDPTVEQWGVASGRAVGHVKQSLTAAEQISRRRWAKRIYCLTL